MVAEYVALQTGIIMLIVVSGLAGVIYLVLRKIGVFR